MTTHFASWPAGGQPASTAATPDQHSSENRLSSYRAHTHHWRVLLLDLSAPGANELAARLVTDADSDIELLSAADPHHFHEALAGGRFDLAVIAATSVDAAMATLSAEYPGVAVPVLLALDEMPPDETAMPTGLPMVGLSFRHTITTADLRAALSRSPVAVAFAANPDGLVLLDADGRVDMANAAAAHLLGRTPGDVRGLQLDLRRDEGGLPLITTSDGRVLEWRQQLLEAPHARAVVSLRDVTEHHAATRVLAFRAEHDTLTGLANLVRLKSELRAAMARAERDGGRLAVLYLDLDGFKEVNDTYGHEVGDALLIAVAQRLTGVCRAGELLARVGGDELVMLAESFPPGFEGRIAERVLESLDSPLQAADRSLRLGLSIGIAVYPDHASDPDGLLRAADEAMYQAKQIGRAHV